MKVENVRWVKSWRNLGSPSRFANVHAWGLEGVPCGTETDSAVLIKGCYVHSVPKLKGNSIDIRATSASR